MPNKEGMVFVGHSVKAECRLCTFFFLFSFFFFESYDYCLWVQNPTCSLRYGIDKTLNYPGEKANPPSPSGMKPTAHLAPNKKPLTS